VILVLAMMACPPATARMLTDDLATQVAISAVVAIASGVLGYMAAAFLPSALGYDRSLGAAGTIALVAGLFQLLAMLFGPKRGRPRVA
jgi:manganese/zinc/iron transport system permease protein